MKSAFVIGFLLLVSWEALPTQAASVRESSSTLLGRISFPNSGSAVAQPDFIAGVLHLHNFEYEQAAEAFRSAQHIDPDFTLAYWGEAMTYNHSLWDFGRQDRAAGKAVLQRLGPTPEARAARAPTAREKMYLHAVEILFGTTAETANLSKGERVFRYREAMRRLHGTHPEDHEAASFYALSILAAGKSSRDFATYMRAAAIVMPVWGANRMHPGAAHYLIHSFDDATHAPLGLPMALAYSKIAPAAAHAQHMTSHIFLALGRWEDVVRANETAFRIETGGIDESTREASHYVHWLHYGYLQQGRYRRAESLLGKIRERLHATASARERGYYGTLYARQLVETGDLQSAGRWAPPDEIQIPSPSYHFVRALAAIERGDLDAARESARRVQAGGGGNPEIILSDEDVRILRLELDAKLALAEAETSRGLALLEEAVALEAARPPTFGPPRIIKPTAELLGDVLLALGRSDQAMKSYEAQLTRTPRRAATLRGLALAAHRGGKAEMYESARQELRDVWRSADGERRDWDGGSEDD